MSIPFFDLLLASKAFGGGSSTPTLIEKSITANGSYSASSDNADGYSSVTVSVPNSYAAGDDGKVVQNGALVSQTSTTTSSNGTIDTTTNNSVTVAVPTYSAADNGKVVQNGELSAQSTHKSVTENGTGIDTTYFSSVDVDVPNSYTAQDEGKVVSNGALVAQGSDTVTQNGTLDTTLISSLLVNVASSGITEGTLTPSGTAYTNPVAKVWGTDGFICAVLNDYYYRVSSQNVQIGTVSGIAFPSSQPQTANIYVIGLNERLGNSGGLPFVSASFNWQSGDITVGTSDLSLGNNTNIHAAVVITW